MIEYPNRLVWLLLIIALIFWLLGRVVYYTVSIDYSDRIPIGVGGCPEAYYDSDGTKLFFPFQEYQEDAPLYMLPVTKTLDPLSHSGCNSIPSQVKPDLIASSGIPIYPVHFTATFEKDTIRSGGSMLLTATVSIQETFQKNPQGKHFVYVMPKGEVLEISYNLNAPTIKSAPDPDDRVDYLEMNEKVDREWTVSPKSYAEQDQVMLIELIDNKSKMRLSDLKLDLNVISSSGIDYGLLAWGTIIGAIIVFLNQQFKPLVQKSKNSRTKNSRIQL